MIAHLTMFPLNVDDEENFAGDLAAILVRLPEQVQREAVEPLLDMLRGLGDEVGRLRANAEHHEERLRDLEWDVENARDEAHIAEGQVEHVRDALRAMIRDGVDELKVRELLKGLT